LTTLYLRVAKPARTLTVFSYGKQSLTQVDFAGKKYAFSFNNEAANTGSMSSEASQ
jgi:hypothetical protein